MLKKNNKSVYIVSIDNVYHLCHHTKLYEKNNKPALIIKEYLVEDENENGVFIQGIGWTSKRDFGYYLNSEGNMFLESFNPDNLNEIIIALEEYLIHLLELCSKWTDWNVRTHFIKKALTDFGLTRKDLIKILYNLTMIESFNELKEIEDKIWIKYLL